MELTCSDYDSVARKIFPKATRFRDEKKLVAGLEPFGEGPRGTEMDGL